MINQQVESEIFNKVFFKYKILKFRQKISNIAFQKRMTISELILRSILNTYNICDQEGELE